jgi:hypothetical protein
MWNSLKIQMDFYADFSELLRRRLKSVGYHLPKCVKPERIPLIYFNVLGRQIDAQPRTIVAASHFPWPADNEVHKEGFDVLLRKIENGEDLRPHLSDKINRPTYNDMLFNDWGIQHLHLGRNVGNNGFVERTGKLLYVFVTVDVCHLITIGDHGHFSCQQMVETVHSHWPHLISRYRLNCIGVEYSPTDEEINKLRKAGVSYPIQVADGAVYMSPGGGFASNGVSDTAVTSANYYQRHIRVLEDYIRCNIDTLAGQAADVGRPFGDALHFKLALEGDIFKAVEKNSKVIFLMPR